MPFDYGLRLNKRQRIANARAKPIEANKNQSVDGAKSLFLGSGSPQNVYLLPQRPNFSFERCPRPKQICDHPNNEPDKISHPVTASPDSQSTASQIEFATGTGIGQRIDVPMFESMTDFVLIDHLGGLTYDPPLDHGGYARLLSRYRRPYQTSDGYLCVLIYNDKQWRSFFEAIGQEEFLEQPRFANHAARHEHIDEIYEEVGSIFLGRTTAEWRELLERADIPVMPMHTLETIIDDPHLNAVGFFKMLDHPVEGRIRQMQVPSTWSVTQPEAGGPAPTLSQHGREILSEAGFSKDEIERLGKRNAVHLDPAS